ncbi:MAG: toxin-activating lysine-acyltransferase, partial [Betaproteobacteria bacterium]
MNTNTLSTAPGPGNAAAPLASQGARPADDLGRLADLAKAQAQRVLHKIPLLGPVTWLMMQQGATRHTLLSELEWRVLPPLVLDQAKLYLRDGAPLAYVSWAKLSQAAAQRYLASPHQLVASDWASGDQIWIIDLFAPFGGVHEVMKDLRENLFAGRALQQLVPAELGLAKTFTWPATTPS